MGSGGAVREERKLMIGNAVGWAFGLGFILSATVLAAEPAPKKPPVTTPKPTAGVHEGKKAGETWSDNELKIPFRWCPPGKFMMGSPTSELSFLGRHEDDENQNTVTLTRGFWLGETEVTQAQWQTVMRTTPWSRKLYVKEGPTFAAAYISHGDAGDGMLEPDSACEFCRRLTEQEQKAGRLPVGWKYTLPTDAQWEYACRAGTTTTYSFGADDSRMGDYAWYDKNAMEIGEKFAHAVGQKKPNAWGLRDMHGNMWEWCLDWRGPKSPGGTDPVGDSEGSVRVSRGGGWGCKPVLARAAYRGCELPLARHYELGFRVALVPVTK